MARGWVNEYGDEYEDVFEDEGDDRRSGGPRRGRESMPPRGRGTRPPPRRAQDRGPPPERFEDDDRGYDDDDDDRGYEDEPRVVMETVQCRSEQEIGRVIGRGGSTVERIQAETGTRIQVDSRTLCVDIKGYPRDVREAVRVVTLVTQEGFGGSVERVPSSDRKASAYAPSPRRPAAGWRCKRSTIETTKTLAGASASSAGRPPRSPPPRARSGRSWRWTARTVSTDRGGAPPGAGLTKRMETTRISTPHGTTAEVAGACGTGITTRGRCGTRLYRSDTTRMGGAGRPGTGA